MKTILAALAALAAIFVASGVSATTINFADATCGGVACTNGQFIDQGFGSTTGANVVYTSTQNVPVSVWTAGGYEDLDAVIYTGNGFGITVAINAEPDYEVSLTELVIAPYLDRTVNTVVIITDLTDNTVVLNTTYAPLSTDGVTTISSTDWTSETGFLISFGPNAWDAGIGSISYSAQLIAAVPLPAAGWLLLSVLGGLFAMRRRTA